MKKIRTQDDIPHYVDASKCRGKRAKAVARMADFTWWLFKHRNHVVTYGFVTKMQNGLHSLGGGTILKENKTIDDVVRECKAYVAKHPKLTEIYVNGGNGEDRPGIPVYHVTI